MISGGRREEDLIAIGSSGLPGEGAGFAGVQAGCFVSALGLQGCSSAELLVELLARL